MSRIRFSSWLFAAGAAIGCCGAALAHGYGWLLVLGFAATGAAIGLRASRGTAANSALTNLDRFRTRSTSAPGMNFDNIGGRPHNDSLLARLTASLQPFQEFAFLAFLAQTTIGFLFIVLAWLATRFGWTGSGISSTYIREIASRLFPIQPGNMQAQAMMELLFVPLTVLYAVSVAGLIAAVLRSAVPILRDLESNWRLLLAILGVLAFVLLIFYPANEYQTATSLKRQLLDGSLIAYLVCFCFIPFLGMFLASELPERRSPRASYDPPI